MSPFPYSLYKRLIGEINILWKNLISLKISLFSYSNICYHHSIVGNPWQLLLTLTDCRLTHWAYPVIMNNSCLILIGTFTLLWRKEIPACSSLHTLYINKACIHNLFVVFIHPRTIEFCFLTDELRIINIHKNEKNSVSLPAFGTLRNCKTDRGFLTMA